MSAEMNDQDIYFVEFFHKVIREDLDENMSSVHKECLKRVQLMLRGSVSFCSSSSVMRCAYIYHYAPCLASTLYHHFGHLIANNVFLLRRIILRQNFTVCCLCGGLPADFLAVTRLLETTLRDCSSGMDKGERRTHLDFVIVSTDSGWTSTAEKMAEKLSEDRGDTCSVIFNLRFLTADFSMPLTDDVKEAFSQSDLVTIVNFISSVFESEQGTRFNIVQALIEYIPAGGVLFFLDSPENGTCDGLKNCLESCDERLVEIYGPLRYSVQRMRLLCRKECIRLYSRYYGWRSCDLESASYVCAWYKRTSDCF